VKAVYPGSFDPATYGHLDIIRRAADLFDELIVAVLINSAKNPLFTAEERIDQLNRLTQHMPNVRVISFSGLLVHFAADNGASVIVRGMRAVTDYEYEFQMALANRALNSKIETLFMQSSTQYQYLSSGLVKEIAKLNGNASEMVPPLILDAMREKLTTEN
jgi:pantetheine-phosphate adenylyltransferase